LYCIAFYCVVLYCTVLYGTRTKAKTKREDEEERREEKRRQGNGDNWKRKAFTHLQAQMETGRWAGKEPAMEGEERRIYGTSDRRRESHLGIDLSVRSQAGKIQRQRGDERRGRRGPMRRPLFFFRLAGWLAGTARRAVRHVRCHSRPRGIKGAGPRSHFILH